MYNEYLEFAKEIALYAGKVMMDAYQQDIALNYKTDKTVVTAVDKKINRYLIERVKEKYKDLSFAIYNKKSNIPEDLEVSTNVEDLNHGSYEELSKEYDEIIKRI